MKRYLLFINHLFATFFYFGYAPLMPGTIGALGGVLIYLLIIYFKLNMLWYTLICIVLLTAGMVIADIEEKKLKKKDASEIVIDEVASVLITMYGITFNWYFLIIGFILNRIGDIVKPFPANKLQSLHGGIGIMADDIVSAVYANIVLRIIIILTGL